MGFVRVQNLGLRVSFGTQGLGSRVWFFIGTRTRIYRSRCRRLLTGLQGVYVYGTVYYFEKDKGGLRSSSLFEVVGFWGV